MGIKNNINKAEVLYQNKNFEQSIEICQKLLAKKPKLFNALQILALNYQGQGKLELALVEFEKAIAINDKHATTYNNIGNIYLSYQDFVQASKYYQKALHIEPLMAEACNNLATCYLKLGDNDAAEASYRKAILLDGKKAEYFMNLGILLTDEGKFDSATQMLLRSLELDTNKSVIYWHVFKILMYRHRYEDALQIADMGLVSQTLSEQELCELLVGKAMLFWLFYNPEEAVQAIQLSEVIYQHEHDSANMANMVIFHRYIKRLLNLRTQSPALYSQIEETNIKEMYFVSESHGFAPNDTLVQYQNECYKIRSIFVLGAKVFHLIDDKENKYKTSLTTLFNGLPANSKVVMGFGEIDCRNNEGIFLHCLKTNNDYHDVIKQMLNKYVQLLMQAAQEHRIDIIIYGVPAPHPFFTDKMEQTPREEFIQLVTFFNQYLALCCKDNNIDFLDVHQLTSDNGVSNLTHHIDGNHLKPGTVPELFKQLTVN